VNSCLHILKFLNSKLPQMGYLAGCEKDGVCDITIDNSLPSITGFTRNEA